MKLSEQTIEIETGPRRYLLAAPADAPTRIVLSLHGTGSTASDQARRSRMSVYAERGALVVYPEAAAAANGECTWDLDADVTYLERLIESLLGRYPVHGGRVSVTGWSGGARMSCRFGSVRSDLVAALGPVGGVRAPSATPLSHPIPLLAFHGTADKVNPYEGGGDERWLESVPEAILAWVEANGVSTVPSNEALGDALGSALGAKITRTTYGSGGEGEVALITVDNAPHVWPGARSDNRFARLFGHRTIDTIDATDHLWSFITRNVSLAG